jgi:hypothetical protein
VGVKRKPGRPAKKIPDWIDSEGFAPNLDVLGDCCGVDRKTIDNARKRFAMTAPKKRPDGRYPIAEYADWLDRHGVSGRRKGAELECERDVKLEHARLRLDRERFEFQRIKDQMLPAAQFEAALARTLSALLAAINAFGSRVNEQLEGLDFNDRAAVLETESELLRKAIASCDYLKIEGADEEEE